MDHLVVEAGDAEPGVPHAGLHLLDEDHNSICRPTSKSSFLYQRVLKFVDSECLRLAPFSSQTDTESPEVSRTVASPRAPAASSSPRGMAQVRPPGPTPLSQGRVRPPIDRNALVDTLERLTPADFQSLVTRVPRAASRVSRQGTVPEHAAELVRWAESPTGPGLATIEGILRNF
jgi:hypothetical protein